MTALNQDYSNIEKVLQHIANGMLVIYQSGSGSFLMLNNLLVSLPSFRNAVDKETLRFVSINEIHPLYDDFNKTFRLANNLAVVMIKNGQINEILYSPISKDKLLNSIQTLVTLIKMQNGKGQ